MMEILLVAMDALKIAKINIVVMVKSTITHLEQSMSNVIQDQPKTLQSL